MTELAHSPRRTVNVQENGDKLFHDLFTGCGSGKSWKERNLPPSFFHPPPPQYPMEFPSPVNHQSVISGISHSYSRSTPANPGAVRSLYPRHPPNTVHQPPMSRNDLPSHHSNSVAPNAYVNYDQKTQFIAQPPMTQHSHHVRQGSFPYHISRMPSSNHPYGSVKQQQSKPALDMWSTQPQMLYQQNSSVMTNATASVGPACQQWSVSSASQNQWQSQDVGQSEAVGYVNVADLPLPAVSQELGTPEQYTTGWQNVEQSHAPTTNWPNTTTSSSVSVTAASETCSQGPVDDPRQKLLEVAARLKEDRNIMAVKMAEIDKRLEEVMAALQVSNVNSANGYYQSDNQQSNPDDLVPSLQIGDQNSSVAGAPPLENGNNPSNWM